MAAPCWFVPPAAGEPPSPAADDRGFVDSAARCDGVALDVGRTQQSLVVICADQNGYQYRGVRLRDGAALTAHAETDGPGFIARNDAVIYAVSPSELLVTSGKAVIKRETMIEYRQPGPFPAEAGPSE